jgi:hypothetical protein
LGAIAAIFFGGWLSLGLVVGIRGVDRGEDNALEADAALVCASVQMPELVG